MGTLSTTAWVLHELGLAAGFGGNLFGSLTLNPALLQLEAGRERGKVEHKAWDRYKLVNAASLAATAATWLAGRTMLAQRAADRDVRPLAVAKDTFVLGSVATGVTALVAGTMLERELSQPPRPPPPSTILRPARPPLSPRVTRLHKIARAASNTNLAFGAAVLATTTLLAVKTMRPRTLAGRLADLLA